MNEVATSFAPRVAFIKASGAGNDFLIIQAEDAPADIHEFTRRICDRTRGIGADGVEYVSAGSDGKADVIARLINSDGSDAELSGNGTRCVAAYWIASHGTRVVRVRTGAGLKFCTLLDRKGPEFRFEMPMEKATVSAEEQLSLKDRSLAGLAVDLGNPHFVIFVPSFEFEWQCMATEIQSNTSRFPKGTNVEFVQVKSEHQIEVRFFERGAGETLSSGTGSCAAAAAALANSKCISPVAVLAPGGTQQVRAENGELSLQGPAQLICAGEFFI